jgi:nucleotide-binding universal stress UspA family protein
LWADLFLSARSISIPSKKSFPRCRRHSDGPGERRRSFFTPDVLCSRRLGGLSLASIPKIEKILYTTDLSENSVYVFRYALNSAEVHDAEIHILYVLKYFFPLPYGFLAVSTPEDEKPAILEQIRRRLDDFVQRELENNPARMNRVSSIQVIEGEPVVEILKKADEMKADVLIMGTHSKGLVSQTFLGSVAADVLQHSGVPVFIIPIPRASGTR